MNEQKLQFAYKLIANYFKNRRKELGYTQEELAAKVGLNRDTIIKFEKCEHWVGLKQYLLICEALHLFPFVADYEEDSELAEMMRKNWDKKPKAMTIEEALKLKNEPPHTN